jgi:Restriction endonuclease
MDALQIAEGVVTVQSIAFEQRVERIHKLLEDQGATVTWNDKLPDPDNPDQARQIDVTVRRTDSLTLVECRIRRAPQDVTWIEELIGRRVSLQADAVIAVSSSGFTEGAQLKAERYGIILRDFQSLSADEIRDWGQQKKVQLKSVEFKNALLRLTLPTVPREPYTLSDALGRPIKEWRGLFQQIMRRLQDEKALEIPGHFARTEIDLTNPMFVNGVRATKVQLKADIKRITQDITLASLIGYADPLAISDGTKAVVGELGLGISEIIEQADRVLIVIDLSQMKVPSQSFFDTVNYDFGRVVTITGTKVIGVQEAMKSDVSLRLEVVVA